MTSIESGSCPSGASASSAYDSVFARRRGATLGASSNQAFGDHARQELVPRESATAKKKRMPSWIRQTNELLRPVPSRGPLVLDLFAGCGGLALGFEAAGFETIGYELSDVYAATYSANLEGSCKAVRITKDLVLPAAPVIVAGPPCQPFSVGGNRQADQDQRDGFPALLAAIERTKPELAIIENVPGLLVGSRRTYFDQTVASLEAMGYVAEHELLNAADFGVPQNRRRVFLVAHRGGFRFPEATHEEAITAGQAIGRLAKHLQKGARFLSPAMDAYVASYEAASKCRHPRDLKLDQPSRTLTCRNLGGATGDMMRIRLDDGRRRRLEIREAARLQAFPDWFKFTGTTASQFRQIGNAVPPLLALALAKQARSYLDAREPQEHASLIERTTAVGIAA
jgi:DNA (cytosine-5)-methyltransferase 1